jgi:hypothetical protein
MTTSQTTSAASPATSQIVVDSDTPNEVIGHAEISTCSSSADTDRIDAPPPRALSAPRGTGTSSARPRRGSGCAGSTATGGAGKDSQP